MKEVNLHRPEVKTFGTPRVNMLLGIGYEDESNLPATKQQEISEIRNSRYGLGNKRTLDQAIEFSGIDLRRKRMVKNKCGNLKWVPFVEADAEHRDYGVSATLGRPYYSAAAGGNSGSENEAAELIMPNSNHDDGLGRGAHGDAAAAANKNSAVDPDPDQQQQQKTSPRQLVNSGFGSSGALLLPQSATTSIYSLSLWGLLVLVLLIVKVVSIRSSCRKSKNERHTI